MAFISAYLGGEAAPIWIMPLVLLALLAVSYATRPPSRAVGKSA
jgi:hypothetical protein